MANPENVQNNLDGMKNSPEVLVNSNDFETRVSKNSEELETVLDKTLS